MEETIYPPAALLGAHLDFLDELRASGITNMYGAGPYLQDNFDDLSREEASAILFYWMKTSPREGE